MLHSYFIESKPHLVLINPRGAGKIHMAIAFGRETCKRGYRVEFAPEDVAVFTLNCPMEMLQRRGIYTCTATVSTAENTTANRSIRGSPL